MGWATNTLAGDMPRDLPWAAAASINSSDATKPDGSPLLSKSMMSCKLHEVHEPQSASPSITASHSTLMRCVNSVGATRVKVGLE